MIERSSSLLLSTLHSGDFMLSQPQRFSLCLIFRRLGLFSTYFNTEIKGRVKKKHPSVNIRLPSYHISNVKKKSLDEKTHLQLSVFHVRPIDWLMTAYNHCNCSNTLFITLFIHACLLSNTSSRHLRRLR